MKAPDVFYEMAEISIYHHPGNFIYTVWDAERRPLYVGGTQDIMAKSFKFDFPYADITGEYWPYPECTFEAEIDERIAKLKPRYNSRLRTSQTVPQMFKYFKAFCNKTLGIPFNAEIKGIIRQELEESDGLEFGGEKYYTTIVRGEIAEILRIKYGTHNI